MAEWSKEQKQLLRDAVPLHPGDWISVSRYLQMGGHQKTPDACRKKAKRMGIKVAKGENKKSVVSEAPPVITGLTAADTVDIDEVWQAVYRVQDRMQGFYKRRTEQVITLPARAVGVAFLSDVHFGSRNTDYRTARRDAEIVRDTEGLYCGFNGDGIDNWIIGKLQGLQKEQAVPFDQEMALFASYLDILKDKLLWVVSGNHEGWTYTLSGLDVVKQLLSTTRALYDPDEVVFTLKVGEADWVMKARHQWKYSSIFNVTHGQEVGWQRGDIDFDIAIGGHTHQGTYCRPFHRHSRKRFAVLIGTYKYDDSYGRKLGMPVPKGVGSGAMIFYPDGRNEFFEDLQTAAEFLTFLRGQGK